MSAIERVADILETARDPLAGFLAVSDNDHKYIHLGKGFSLVGTTGSLAEDAKWYVSFRTPPASSGKYVHLRPAVLASSANLLVVTLLEGAAFTAGDAAVPLNLNRNSPLVPSSVLTTNATSVSGGTSILLLQAGEKSGSQGTGGGVGAAMERVLKPDTDYVYKFHNAGTVTATIGYFDLFWYEEAFGLVA